MLLKKYLKDFLSSLHIDLILMIKKEEEIYLKVLKKLNKNIQFYF